ARPDAPAPTMTTSGLVGTALAPLGRPMAGSAALAARPDRNLRRLMFAKRVMVLIPHGTPIDVRKLSDGERTEEVSDRQIAYWSYKSCRRGAWPHAPMRGRTYQRDGGL